MNFLREETGRSESALRKALENRVQQAEDPSRITHHASRLRIACGNDDALYRRVLPWAGLIREDNYGYPVVIPAGSVYVTAGATRRATGTHYTPRSLTEPIVQHTLEPLVYVGPAEGRPRQKWQLRSPAEILALKVCDMAMGSGAFLVQADRWLAERLVESMEVYSEQLTVNPSKTQDEQLPVNPSKTQDEQSDAIPQLLTDYWPLLTDSDERLVLARRLVADRCLYGVDKNPLAVEMAKLSLWLVTLDKNRPFTFLDHALKHGDSLIGADEEMFLRWAHTIKGPEMSLFDELNRQELEEARRQRQALQAFTVRDVRDAEEKARLLAEAEAAMDRIKLGCDLLVGVRLLDDLSESEKEAVLAQAQLDYTAGREMSDPDAQRALTAARDHAAFHWPFEFPEVFAQGGHSAFVGNPPFIGGKKIRDTLGNRYREALYQFYPSAGGNADYCAFFFLRGYRKLRNSGTLGFVATNTIAQGDTREAGLDVIVANGGTIYSAVNNMNWPGVAAITINVVHIAKQQMKPPFILDNRPEDYISSLLDNQKMLGDPFSLAANESKSFIGSYPRGRGFVLESHEAQELLKANSRNRSVVIPYLIGQDLNNNPDQLPSRWLINFSTLTLAQADTFPDVMKIVIERVYPERMDNEEQRKIYQNIWWKFWRTRDELYNTIQPMSRVIVSAQTSKYLSISFYKTAVVFDQAVVVIALDDDFDFALLASSFHDVWVRKYSATMRNAGIRYTPSDCFQNFPFPDKSNAQSAKNLRDIAKLYNSYRSNLMVNQEVGLTATYNRFHDPEEMAEDIARLRELHVEMDNAVAAAYGWDDLDLGHDFHETLQGIHYTISEAARREVLGRLLKLNHERYEEEVKLGLHEKKGRRRKAEGRKKGSRKGAQARRGRKGKKGDGQMSLF